MTELQKRKIYYLFFGAPFLLSVILAIVISTPLFTTLFFLIGFFLPCVYGTPGLREKVFTKKYAVSFVKILFIIKESSEKLLPLKNPSKEMIARHVPGILMVNVIYTLTSQGFLPIWFLSAVIFEVVLYFYFLKVGKSDVVETPQENLL